MSIVRSLHRSILTSAAAALLLATVATPAVTQPASAAGGSSFVSVTNTYRQGQGLAPVSLHAMIDQIAVERGQQLAADGQLGHDFDYIKKRFNDFGICWRGFGEIVAYNGSGDYSAFGSQWWNSDPHRKIMLGDYTHAGGSREASGNRWYGVMIFVKFCGAPPGSFADIGGSIFRADIEWLVDREITGGCSATHFCPTRSVTREQMASFLKRAMGLPAATKDYYADDGSSVHEDDINRISDAAVTDGCGAARYCPTATVNRGEMASFLARALNLGPTSTDYFSDDNGSLHEDAINRLAKAGIVDGCGDGKYCPGWGVSREQMAAFIHRAFD